MMSIGILASLLINLTSSVGVIMINKELVFKLAGFRFGTLLTIIHFIVTFIGCVFFAKVGLYRPKRLNVWRVVPISLAFCGYVVFNNLSLLTNSVSVYQVSKIFCTPVIVLIEAVLYGKRERPATLLALVPVCVGVFFTVFTSADLNIVGSFWAILAVLCNSLYTIWGKTKQEELQVEPMQLLLYQAPMSAVLLLATLPFFDDMGLLAAYEVTGTTAWTVALSCVFAFGVNFSFFLFVGKTSPLTVNVLGYLKTALVFVLAFLFTRSEATPQTIFGVALTLVGLALYTRARMTEKKAKSGRGGGSGETPARSPASPSSPHLYQRDFSPSRHKVDVIIEGDQPRSYHVRPFPPRPPNFV